MKKHHKVEYLFTLLYSYGPPLGGAIYLIAQAVLDRPFSVSADLNILILLVVTMSLPNLVNAIKTAEEDESVEKILEHQQALQAMVGKFSDANLTDKLNLAIHRIEVLGGSLEKTARLVESPENEVEPYVTLFSGFSGVFYAYNPAYAIESNPGLHANLDRIIERVFVPRYRAKCHAQYLFFTGDEYGKHDIKSFSAVMKQVARVAPEIKKCLEVRIVESKRAASFPEIYFGVQCEHHTVVHELSEPGVILHGHPSFYCTTISKKFHDLCLSQFRKDWDGAHVKWDVFEDKRIDRTT